MWVPLCLFDRWKSGLREVKSMLFKVTRLVRWCQDSDLTRSTSRPVLFPLDPCCSKCDALSSPSSHREPLQNAGDSALPPTCRARICIWTSPPAVLYACQAEKRCPQPSSSGNVGLCLYFPSAVNTGHLWKIVKESDTTMSEQQHFVKNSSHPWKKTCLHRKLSCVAGLGWRSIGCLSGFGEMD